MNKRELNARVKYLRQLVADLEAASATQRDRITAARYQEAAIAGKALIGGMIIAWQRHNA